MWPLARALSWPLINVPVQIQCDVGDDKLDAITTGGQAEVALATASIVNHNGDINHLDQKLCCRYECPAGCPEKGKPCCCEVQLRNGHHSSAKKSNGNLFSRLIRFSRANGNGNLNSRRNKNLMNGHAEGKTTDGGGENPAVQLNGDRSVIVDEEQQEKKIVTSSPTFQQLILTRRLLCRHYYPEGGWGWLIIIVAVLVQTLSHGLHLAFGILLLPASRRFYTRWYHTSKYFSKIDNGLA